MELEEECGCYLEVCVAVLIDRLDGQVIQQLQARQQRGRGVGGGGGGGGADAVQKSGT
jgi:hypothetical protein